MHNIQTIDDIDFAALYRAHVQLAERKPKPPADWDARAQEYALTTADPQNPYTRAFIAHMDLRGVRTLLDVGCGPGTIGLPLAPRLQQVYALDYSAAMLQALQARAATQGIRNVQCLHLSWDDDWHGVPLCDVAVASRATMVRDLENALTKLNGKARQHVYATFTVNRHFLSSEIMECLGRPRAKGFPNYMYALNLLHRMGYLPRVDYIENDMRKAPPDTEDGFIKSVEWSVGQLSMRERALLHDYYQSTNHTQRPLISNHRTWALVSWATSATRRH